MMADEQERPPLATSSERPPACVLVVDDDPDIVDVLSLILESRGYRVLSARDGHRALQLLKGPDRPQLVLLDLMMPGMDGWQFFAEQRADPELARVPVVLLTGNAQGQGELEGLGAAGYLRKPVELQTLLETVKRYC
jgi:two-component system response regulator MprA